MDAVSVALEIREESTAELGCFHPGKYTRAGGSISAVGLRRRLRRDRCAGSARGVRQTLRSLPRSPQLRSFAPLTRGSPLVAHFASACRTPLASRHSAATARATKAPRSHNLPRTGRASLGPLSRECGSSVAPKARRWRLTWGQSCWEGGAGPRSGLQSEREEETRDRAERGSVVRGSPCPQAGTRSERSRGEDSLRRTGKMKSKSAVLRRA